MSRTRLLAILAALLPMAPSGAGTPRFAERDAALLEGCRERFVIVAGDPQLVRARVPTEFELATNAAGRPLLYASAIRCERYTVGASSAPTTAAAFAAMVRSPDGVGCASEWPVVGDVKGDALSCNLYVLFAAYDNPSVVSWLRAGTPDLPVHHVADLRFDEGVVEPSRLGVPLRFRAGRPSPSPFDIEAVVRERPVTAPFTATFWARTRAGTVRIRFESDALALGDADGVLRPMPGTEMARVIGTDVPASEAPFRVMAGNRWEMGSLTKTVI
ncbi:MAG TPA: hypothetical protein VM618_04815 [Acidimicrobiia bacterium]|nr:hypothetical protein [Acidimicrobiia bacterium]